MQYYHGKTNSFPCCLKTRWLAIMAHYDETVTKRIILFPYIHVKNFFFFSFTYLSNVPSQKGRK